MKLIVHLQNFAFVDNDAALVEARVAKSMTSRQERESRRQPLSRLFWLVSKMHWWR